MRDHVTDSSPSLSSESRRLEAIRVASGEIERSRRLVSDLKTALTPICISRTTITTLDITANEMLGCWSNLVFAGDSEPLKAQTRWLPPHIVSWVWKMEPHLTTKPEAMHEERSDEVSCAAIEEAVLAGGSRVASAKVSTDEKTAMFGRHLFQSKKEHRVTCLLASASAKLISQFANDKALSISYSSTFPPCTHAHASPGLRSLRPWSGVEQCTP